MNLTAATASDAEAMAMIHARSFHFGWTAPDIVALLSQPGGYGFVMRDEHGVAGFLIGRVTAGEAEVMTVAVDPGRRGDGLGRALIEACALAAAAGGADALFLEVAADNLAAVALYENAEFVRIGERPRYYQRPGGAVDALVFRRDLNTAAG